MINPKPPQTEQEAIAHKILTGPIDEAAALVADDEIKVPEGSLVMRIKVEPIEE